MAQKSILEQALLQVGQLEEAVKANAKGILASTMKQELNSLLKEQEDEDPEEEEKDVPELTGDEEPSISDEEPTADEEVPAETEDDIPALDNELEDEPEMEPSDDEEDSDDVLDMTGASEAEVMKVFKAMKPEDGIVVKKEGGNVQFSDGENEYIIKLDGEEAEEETPEFPEGLSEQTEPTGKDEIVYEIELDDDDEEDEEKECETTESTKSMGLGKPKMVEPKEGKEDGPFTKTAPKNGVKKLQANEQNAKMGQPAIKGMGSPKTDDLGKGQPKTSDGRPGTGVKGMDSPKKFDNLGKGKNQTSDGRPGTGMKGTTKPVVKEPKEQLEVGKECKECGKEMEATEAARTKWNPHGNKGEAKRAGLPSKKIFKAGSGVDNINEEVEILRKQNGEYKKALVLFKDKLNEVAVFNANLAYATRLFTEHSTTKQEKLAILKRFDAVSVITESKNLYNTIKTELETANPLSESVAKKITSSPKSSATEVLSEAKAYENPQFARMKDLMKKIQ
jgi:hypothetical protein